MLKLLLTDCKTYININKIEIFWINKREHYDTLCVRTTNNASYSIIIKKDTTIEQAIKENLITINEDTNEQSIDTDSTL